MTTPSSQRMTVRDLGYTPGSLPQGDTDSLRDLGYNPPLPAGPTNSILDIPGVHISQVTIPTSSSLKEGSTATKGVTVISPRPPKDVYKPCNAGTFCFNGNGEMTGSRQVADWGFTNTPIAFTNSLSLGTVFDGMWDWVLDQQERMKWDELTIARHYGTPVVGETADWIVNSEVRQSRVDKADIKRAFEGLKSTEDGATVQEGQFGGGSGMTCHMFAGGTGTASRIVDAGREKKYTVGVLCQSNYGHLAPLVIGGVPIGKILQKEKAARGDPEGSSAGRYSDAHASYNSNADDQGGRTKDGSIVILIVTDAPLSVPQLQRLARHATTGLALVGSDGIGRNFSGDIFLALSTADAGPQQLSAFKPGPKPTETYTTETVKNESIDQYFVACTEATEEAILNSMVGGRDGTVGMNGEKIEGLPVNRVKELLERYLVRL